MLKKIGLGLRVPYINYILENSQELSKKIGWFEVHSENYYAEAGPAINTLKAIRKNFPISLHSVGNSLGSADYVDLKHLEKLKNLIKIIDPFLVSDHISWGMIGDKHFNDLLPLPYSTKALNILCNNIDQVQNFLGRKILIENPSTYLAFKNADFSEFEFINLVAKKTGCGLVLDVNNVYVSAFNNAEFDPENYLKNIDQNIVQEIHLAGHSSKMIFDGKKSQEILIDTHNNKVKKAVWQLFDFAIKKFGQIPSLIEWDQDFPEFKILLEEAKKAENILLKYE